LHLAEADNDQKLYKDAGLSFMRIAIYFPRSSYKGPALLEAGVVHKKIGRDDLATKLWQKAQIEIDDQTDPTMAKRLEQVLAEE